MQYIMKMDCCLSLVSSAIGQPIKLDNFVTQKWSLISTKSVSRNNLEHY